MSTLTVSNITGNPTSGLGTITTNTNTATFGTSVYMVASGNVGIGTSTPPAKLTANGTIRTTSTGASGYIDIRHDGTNAVLVGNTGSLLAYAEGLNSIIFHTNNTQRFSIASDGSFSSVIPSGSTLYPAFYCRAWVNFNGTGTVAIVGSGNVTSITDNGTGNYTVNFTTAMPDANYSVVASGASTATPTTAQRWPAAVGTLAAGSVRILTPADGTTASTLGDFALVNVAVFR